MQPIERYALVTLLFLVVLVMVVALWDDGSSAAAKPERGPEAGTVARLEDPGARQRQDARRASTPSRQVSQGLPTSDRRAVAPGMRRVSTRPAGDARHSIEPGRDEPTSFQPRKPRAQTPEQLAELMTPNRRETGNSTPGGSFLGRPDAAGPQAQDQRALNSSVDSRAGTSNQVERSEDRSLTSAPAFKPRPATASRKQPAAPTGKTSSGAKSRSYTIRSGDSLERIARRELPNANTTAGVVAIAQLNGLSKPYTIYAGDDLQIPASSTIAASDVRSPATQTTVSASGSSPGSSSGGRPVYTIRSGEVLSNVLVARFGTYKRSLSIVLDLNPGLDADHVRAGTKIVMPRADEIPGGTTKVAKSTTVKPSRRAAATNSEFVVR